jgi:hypothetical protein
VAGGRISLGRDGSDADFKALEHTVQARLAKRLRLPVKADFRRVFV